MADWQKGDRFRTGKRSGVVTKANHEKQHACVRYDDGGETLLKFDAMEREPTTPPDPSIPQ